MRAIYTLSNALYPIGAFLIAIIASGLIFFSSRKQSLTIDETNHLYCGMEWLQKGTYTAWPENPPLSRIIVAAGPYLQGYRTKERTEERVTMKDYFRASYDFDYFYSGAIKQKLLWMRILIIPVFLISVLVVWFWARFLGGNEAGFLAVGMYCTLPPILAHSGLATTDITFVSFFTLLMFCFTRWLKKPTPGRGVLFGLSLGAALLSKYSVLAFFPVAALLMLVLFYSHERKKWEIFPAGKHRWMALKSGILGILVAFLCVWAFFGFGVGTLGNEPVIRAGIQEERIPPEWGKILVPAPEWFAGLGVLLLHNEQGHPSYLAGSLSTHGFWFYYPLTSLIKTPLPFLLFFLAGVVGAFLPQKQPRNWEVLGLCLLPFIIFLSGLFSNINIGLRHILVIYPLGAVGASAALVQLFKQYFIQKPFWRTALPAGLVLWQLGVAGIAYPHYLSYFNAFAGDEPGEFLVDSDLDWGQGMFELARFCRVNKIDSLSIAYYGLAEDCWYGLPATKLLSPDSATAGWVAVSETLYRGLWAGDIIPLESCNFLAFDYTKESSNADRHAYQWLDKYPLIAILGGSIRVYYIDEKEAAPKPPTPEGAAAR